MSGEPEDSGEAPASINVRCSNGAKVSVSVPLSATVASFKALLASSCDVPPDQQRLIYKGRILRDDLTLRSYGVEPDHTIHLVRGSSLPAPSNPSSGTNAGSLRPQISTQTDGNAGGLRGTEDGGLANAGIGGSLFPGLGFAGSEVSDIFGAGFPDFGQMQQQLNQNPNIMREVMNIPFVQNLMNNPDLMRNFIMSNPQMREIIDRNPELAHILNDPSTLRQTLEATRNPELMREMMRNTDRAMSNIESSPEGFNMLRRMYENVQEPLLNATTMAAERGNDNSTRERSANLSATTGSENTTASTVPNTTPLPNPWGSVGGRNNSSRPPPAGGTAGLAGLSGLALPELQQGMPDSSSVISQILQNPATSQLMQSFLSNPQYINQLLNYSPEMRNLTENNPQIREMLQNPEFLRQLSNPETLRNMLSLQQSLSALGLQQPGQLQNQNNTAGLGSLNMGLDQLLGMFPGLGLDGGSAPNISNAVPPEERYATQLSQLQEMGFFDTQENIRALMATLGNVHAAVERLLGNSGQ